MHILSLVTDNNFLKSAEGRRMTIEIISRLISKKVWDWVGIQLAAPGSAVRHTSVARQVTDCPTQPGATQWKCLIEMLPLSTTANTFQELKQIHNNTFYLGLWQEHVFIESKQKKNITDSSMFPCSLYFLKIFQTSLQACFVNRGVSHYRILPVSRDIAWPVQ